MHKTACLLLLALATGPVGCGSKAPSTAPLTDDQKQKLRAEDEAVDADEKSGSGTAVNKKKR